MTTIKIGSRAGLVRTLQYALLARGYDLPRWGADGALGSETWLTLADFAENNGIRWAARAIESERGHVPRAVVDSLLRPMEPPPPLPAPTSAADLTDVLDLRTQPSPKTKRDAEGRVVMRDPTEIDGITVHQTACLFGVSAQMVGAAGGDARLALRRRVLNVACHAIALRNGDALLTNDVHAYVYHGNRLNASTLGLEIEGRLPGLVSKPAQTTWGGAPTSLTPALLDAARVALHGLCERGRAAGMPIRYVYAHRQSSHTRRSDPGEEVWKKLVLDYAVPELGLEARPAFTIGDGRAIPSEWDTGGVDRY